MKFSLITVSEVLSLLIQVSEVVQTYQQNGRKFQAEVFDKILQPFRHGIEVDDI